MRWPWQKRHDEMPEVVGRDAVEKSRAVAVERKKETNRVLGQRVRIIKENRFVEDYGLAFYGALRRTHGGRHD